MIIRLKVIVAAAAVLKQRKRLLHGEKKPFGVDAECFVKVCFGGFPQWCQFPNAGVGEQDVYAALLFSFTVACSLSRSARFETSLNTGELLLPIRLTAASSLALAAAGDEHICALLHKPPGRGKANAAVSACYYRNFSFQPFHGFLLVMVDIKFAKAEKETFGPYIY